MGCTWKATHYLGPRRRGTEVVLIKPPFTVFCLYSLCYWLVLLKKDHTKFSFTPEICDLFQTEIEELLYI